jgi:hypothetical protein
MFDKLKKEEEGEMVEERRGENIEESIESTSTTESVSEIGIGHFNN